MKLTKKQTIAIDYLEDEKTTEVYYGGAAGGGKSYFGSYWELKWALRCNGSRWLMGRSELKNLKKTTLNSFFEVCKSQGLIANQHFRYNQQDSIIYLFNGSQIILADLFAYPSDPEFDSLGSLEITGAFIDEAPQVTAKGKSIVKSRIRYKLDCYCGVCGDMNKPIILETDDTGKPKKWVCGKGHITIGLLPKLLMCGNPSKNWAYYDFYRAEKEGTIKPERKFIQALVTDNPYISPHYIESLRSLDNNSRERLLNGNWEYDDDPATLIEYEKILDCFTNDFVDSGDSYISADIARFGSDRTVLGVWSGYRVMLYTFSHLSITETADKIRELQIKHKVPNSRTIADEDGVGGGVVDILKCKGFVNNSRPLPNPITRIDENYVNLKSQCYFRLAERINKGGLYIETNNPKIKQDIIEELEQVKQYNMDKDGKRAVLPKDKVKEIIGRSPDFADTLMMREWFELTPRLTWVAK